jgi:hypothetical protein
MSITPTVGRIVWWWQSEAPADAAAPGDKQPEAAVVTYVHSNDLVNLTVFNRNGVPRAATSVVLWQDGQPRPIASFAEWMPYQKGQAAKTEASEAAAKVAAA